MFVFLTLAISKLCGCDSLSSMEMFDVFDESDIDLPVRNVTDNVFRGDFGNNTDESFLDRESSNERIDITYGILDDNTEMNHSDTDGAAKLIIDKITDNGHTNKLIDKQNNKISYDEVKTNAGNNPAKISNDTAYNNGSENKGRLNNATKVLFYTGMFNNNSDNETSYLYNNDDLRYYNNGHENRTVEGAQTQNAAAVFTNNDTYVIDRANENGDHVNKTRYFYNNATDNNINRNEIKRIDEVTEKSLLNYKNISGNIKTQLLNKTVLPTNQNGYSWTFTPFYINRNATDSNSSMNITNFNKGTLPAFSIPASPFSCPEEEPPSNIGPYEIPTERDMVLHMKTHLLAMYQGFHTRAMHFLKDVKEATQASWSRKEFCHGPTELMFYRRCVRWVGDMSVRTTKSLVTALETIRGDVSQLIQGKVCSMSALTVDPIHLLRILAAEKVSLEFALPDFLRQLHACSRHCPSVRRKILQEKYLKSAHLTDQDFVVRHYFSQQNYNSQLKQQYKF